MSNSRFQIKAVTHDKVDNLNNTLQSMHEHVRKKPLPVEPRPNTLRRTDYSAKPSVDVDDAADSLSKM